MTQREAAMTQREPARLRQILRDLVLWLPIGALPLVNGIIRMTTYQAALGESLSGWVSASLDIAGITAYAMLLRAPPSPLLRASLWLTLTTLLHFALGRAFGMTPSDSLHKYDLLAGEAWLLVSLAVFAAPLVGGALRRRAGRRRAHDGRPPPLP